MIDRENVIKGLEELEGFLFKEYTNIKAEESKIYYDRFKSLSDGIALLKEQEAHLLDISEIYTAHKLDVLIEEKGDNTVHTLTLVETEMTDKRQAAFFFPMIVRPVKAYGKTWRCWSARPTDEQRKEAKWE